MAFGELLMMLKFRSVSLKKKKITYHLKWMAEVFLKEFVVIYLTSPKVKKRRLDQVDPTLKSIYHSRYFSILKTARMNY